MLEFSFFPARSRNSPGRRWDQCMPGDAGNVRSDRATTMDNEAALPVPLGRLTPNQRRRTRHTRGGRCHCRRLTVTQRHAPSRASPDRRWRCLALPWDCPSARQLIAVSFAYYSRKVRCSTRYIEPVWNQFQVVLFMDTAPFWLSIL